ncbi:MAG: hypothetical protein RMK29_06295 [Myxococcales bacterium]|nr:hypothetical protein [Myxococcota bacterium]MDW8281302.1 hypothetical protein [Myxococcales bacterium]
MRATRLFCVCLVGLSACTFESTLPPELPAGDETLGHPFYHEEEVRDVFADGNQLPPTLSVRMHACGKIAYDTLGRALASRGVDLTSMVPDSAGVLYRSGSLMLGAPSYEARVPEALRSTTGGLTRLSDILIAAAPELIAKMHTRPECQLDGQPAPLFDERGCNPLGFACLIGAPPAEGMMGLCNEMVARATDRTIGQQLAVAAIAAAYFLCE